PAVSLHRFGRPRPEPPGRERRDQLRPAVEPGAPRATHRAGLAQAPDAQRPRGQPDQRGHHRAQDGGDARGQAAPCGWHPRRARRPGGGPHADRRRRALPRSAAGPHGPGDTARGRAPGPAGPDGSPEAEERRRTRAAELLRSAERKREMSGVLSAGGFVAEATGPAHDAVELALAAVAVRHALAADADGAPVPESLLFGPM